MKTIVIVAVIILALVGIAGIIYYVMHHEASVQIKETSLHPRECIQAASAATFAPLTQAESESLAMIEDKSLFGLSAGAFNPQFEPLSSSEQETLKISEGQNPGLQNMAAGDLDDQAGHTGWTWGAILLGILVLVIII